MRKITRLIVHCSATPNNRDVTVEQIRKWHKQRGWSDIGYHYVIYRNGQMYSGRPVPIIGAHCRGYNEDSIGVCLIGADEFKPEQFRMLRNLYAMLQNIVLDISIHGHREFNDNKTCPNFDVKEVISESRKENKIQKIEAGYEILST